MAEVDAVSGVTAATRLVALLGHPVAHSISPQIHNAAFAAAGVDAVYVALDVEPKAVAEAVRGLAALGLLGANVTVPHKRDVYEAVPRRTPAAAACGAANTLYWEDGQLKVDNTDVEGLRHVFAQDLALQPGDRVVVLGGGGAARAAAAALGGFQARVEFVTRRPGAGDEVARVLAVAGGVPAAVPEPRVVINATPLGLHGEPLPDRLMRLAHGQVALDLVYGPSDTPFLAAARAGGAQALDGRGLLVAQAAASFRRWTGLAPPRGLMVAAAQWALGESGFPEA